jgi:hypothetical protein
MQVSERGERREIFATVSSGGSFGASSLRPHIGLGGAPSVDFLEVRWPGSGKVQRFEGPIAGDRAYVLREGRAQLALFRPLP